MPFQENDHVGLERAAASRHAKEVGTVLATEPRAVGGHPRMGVRHLQSLVRRVERASFEVSVFHLYGN